VALVAASPARPVRPASAKRRWDKASRAPPGDVMKESAQAALTLIKVSCAQMHVAPELFEKSDIHVLGPTSSGRIVSIIQTLEATT
jgi:hypothetical protein